jgi:carbonic anhydrase/acetyltransferase-like protein (isoleucine patch superfamily)
VATTVFRRKQQILISACGRHSFDLGEHAAGLSSPLAVCDHDAAFRGEMSGLARSFRYIPASAASPLCDEAAPTKNGTSRMIDPTAFIAHGAVILGDVHLGKDSSVWYNTVIRGDVAQISIGDETNIQDLSMLHADEGLPCSVGNRVTVGHRVILHGCTVEDECLIGMGAILLNRVRVGRGSVIGAGALLLEGTEVPPGSLVVGLPGKVVRAVDEGARQLIEEAWRHYVSFAERHRSGAFRVLR